jgi:hypothetical protein
MRPLRVTKDRMGRGCSTSDMTHYRAGRQSRALAGS